MNGKKYADLVAAYIATRFRTRNIQVYREVPLGTSILGRPRRIDVMVSDPTSNRALAVECKFQKTQGTADEKIPYALQDIGALRMPGCIAYAGDGFSEGILHLLQASELAAYCLPDPEDLSSCSETWELDHVLAVTFRWWDVFIGRKKPVRPD